jgi:hypothetical protein
VFSDNFGFVPVVENPAFFAFYRRINAVGSMGRIRVSMSQMGMLFLLHLDIYDFRGRVTRAKRRIAEWCGVEVVW